MSFILDALKKSESERQRQSGPALFEVKIAPPRNRFATWGVVIAALLAVNFIVVGFVLWRGSPSRAAASAVATPAAAPAPAPPPVATAAAAPAQSGALSGAPPGVPASARFGAHPEPGQGLEATGPPAAAPAVPTSSPSAAPEPPSASPRVSAGDTSANPDDLAPAVEPRATPAQPVTGVIRSTESGLPTYQDAAAEPGANIPSLSLDLHVYAPQPDQRFVFLNMLRLREGDTSPQGVRVERITPDGVVLSYQGKEFMLQRH